MKSISQEFLDSLRQETKSIYDGSKFEFYRKASSGTKGKLGELIVKEHLRLNGVKVQARDSKQHDFIANGYKIELKASTLWSNSLADPWYKFQQIRQQQDYELLMLLFVMPDKYKIAWCAKTEAGLLASLSGQHSGNKAEETAWLTIGKPSEYKWLLPVQNFIALQPKS